MSQLPSYESTFVENLPLIERLAAAIGRRQGLGDEDCDDLTSWIKLRLVESDYAVFRKFRGQSSLSTYLTVVIAMLVRDYRVQRWGRWRASASARRKGNLAVRLETLVHRDRLPLNQAAELLRTSGETERSDRELASLLSELPARTRLRPVEVGAEPLTFIEASSSAEVRVVNEDAQQERARAEQILQQTLDALPVEDRLILRMRFWENLGVADIARALSLEQKPLYRRLERLLALLRERLTQAGVTRQHVAELLEEPLS